MEYDRKKTFLSYSRKNSCDIPGIFLSYLGCKTNPLVKEAYLRFPPQITDVSNNCRITVQYMQYLIVQVLFILWRQWLDDKAPRAGRWAGQQRLDNYQKIFFTYQYSFFISLLQIIIL